MDHRQRMVLASAGIVAIFFLIQVGALAFAEPAEQQGLQEVEDGGSPSLSIGFFLLMLVATGLMLAALKYGGADLLRLFIIFASGYISFFVFDVLGPNLLVPTVAGLTFDAVALGGAVLVAIALYAYPEWYVIDGAGIIMGIGAAGLFGINFGVLPAIVLLSVLAVYDAVSVYGTEHMLTLASGVMEMRVPVVLVIPLKRSYSFLDAEKPATLEEHEDHEDNEDNEENGDNEEADDGENPDPITISELQSLDPESIAELEPERFDSLEQDDLDELDEERREAVEEAFPERDALFIGLGDAIIPTVLVASAAFFLDTSTVAVAGISATVPAVTAMLGTLVGLVLLLTMVAKGRAHAGLPLLNGGAIGGYLVGALASGLTLAEAFGLAGGLL